MEIDFEKSFEENLIAGFKHHQGGEIAEACLRYRLATEDAIQIAFGKSSSKGRRATNLIKKIEDFVGKAHLKTQPIAIK